MPSSTAANVAFLASSILNFRSSSSVSVAAPTWMLKNAEHQQRPITGQTKQQQEVLTSASQHGTL